MKTINTLADFKRLLTVGTMVHCIFHMERAGRDEKGNMLYKDLDRGAREVSIKQTNSFALKTVKTDGTTVDSWCHYPKAAECKIENNRITIYEEDREGKQIPILTYWLTDKEQPTEKKLAMHDKLLAEIGPEPTYNQFYTAFLKIHREEHPHSGTPGNHLISMFYDDYLEGNCIPSY